ncbi:hypothetical protein GCM10009576_099060 [Streptomyces rhizosphaericus]|uniref:Uncharacterized protein n=1 Tax=Streptomyces rhizosphaericus TaxID=114699 RepID=A0ABP4DU53_9ACTN
MHVPDVREARTFRMQSPTHGAPRVTPIPGVPDMQAPQVPSGVGKGTPDICNADAWQF